MVAATSTMFDVLSWGGETQALIYHPGQRKVIGINALGVAPSGATPEFFKERGMKEELRKWSYSRELFLVHEGEEREAPHAGELFRQPDLKRMPQELGGLHTMADLANLEVNVEEPVTTNYKGIDVYKLTTWVQGPITAIYFDQKQRTFQGGASDFGEDYGIAW